MSEELIARMECSDCKASYYAKLVERGGKWEIGERVEKPADGVEVRNQRMLCGDCKGKGGPGDQLEKIMRRQRGGYGGMGPGNDPFGLF